MGAGMLMMAAGDDGEPRDNDALRHWTRIAHERGMRWRHDDL